MLSVGMVLVCHLLQAVKCVDVLQQFEITLRVQARVVLILSLKLYHLVDDVLLLLVQHHGL